MNKTLTVLLLCGVCLSANARQDCPPAKIEHIQIEIIMLT